MDEQFDEELPLSKTKRKQLAKEVEQLADQLASLPENQFAQLDLSEEVREEVEIARTTKGRSSHRRQIKHLAGVLRKRDAELPALINQMANLDQVKRAEKQEFHQLESLRDRLCDAASFDAAFNELLDLCPQIDRKAITRLARSVHQHNDRRAAREIFRRLRDELTSAE